MSGAEGEQPEQARWAAHAGAVRRRILEMSVSAGHGHVGPALSCADLLTFVRFHWMRGLDRMLLSKGHAAAALYAVLAEAGELAEDELATFARDGTFLAAHPPPNRLASVPFATGSLGHGLALATGLAFGARLDDKDERTFCITSDGELQEGSTWEAALFASHHRLTNLIWLIDRNEIQAFGRTEDVVRLEPLAARLEALGFDVREADGHDFAALAFARAAAERAIRDDGRPQAIVCRTIKGHGVARMEGTIDSHYLPLDRDSFERAMAEVRSRFFGDDS